MWSKVLINKEKIAMVSHLGMLVVEELDDIYIGNGKLFMFVCIVWFQWFVPLLCMFSPLTVFLMNHNVRSISCQYVV